MGAIVILGVVSPAAAQAPLTDEQAGELPRAAALRRPLAEPVGAAPSPWPALSAALDGGPTVDGEQGQANVRVHVPVARRYGAVDVRLRSVFDGDGLVALDPELTLRAIPLQRAQGRGGLGVAVGFAAGMAGDEPRLVISGGVMGGYIGRSWFARGYVGARGEVLDQSPTMEPEAEIVTSVAGGVRFPCGVRPQLEIDVVAAAEEQGEVALVIRPALRYWPADWIGIGLSADLWAVGDEPHLIRLDLVFLARE